MPTGVYYAYTSKAKRKSDAVLQKPVCPFQIRARQGVASTSQGAYYAYVTKRRGATTKYCESPSALFKYEQDKEDAHLPTGVYYAYTSKAKRKSDEVLRSISKGHLQVNGERIKLRF